MKNRGFSLIELVVVVAIMGVALAIGGYSINAISLSRAKNCATEINYALERTRTQSYSSDGVAYGTATLKLYRDGKDIYIEKSYESSRKKIGSGAITVTYTLKGDTTEYDLGSDQMVFSFNKSSGAFRTTSIGAGSGIVTAIKVASGGKTYTITCYEKTGRTILE